MSIKETPSEKSENVGRVMANVMLNFKCVSSQESGNAQLQGEHASLTSQKFSVS